MKTITEEGLKSRREKCRDRARARRATPEGRQRDLETARRYRNTQKGKQAKDRNKAYRRKWHRDRRANPVYREHDNAKRRVGNLSEAQRAKAREQNLRWAKERYRRNSIPFRLRARIREAVKLQRGQKSTSLHELVGCSIAHLREHIERLFTHGMTWAAFNAGRIHIDHKRPCATFDLTDSSQQRRCFHYTNLQPLWASENIRKGKKWRESLIDREPPPRRKLKQLSVFASKTG